MILIIKNKYTKINIIKLINTLNLNFIILNNKLIFTHTITQNNIKQINKLLKYYKYKIIKNETKY
jgi:hypothetical protein